MENIPTIMGQHAMTTSDFARLKGVDALKAIPPDRIYSINHVDYVLFPEVSDAQN